MAIIREARGNQIRRRTAAIIGSSLSLQRSSFSSPLCISYSIYQGEAINIFALNNHYNLNHYIISLAISCLIRLKVFINEETATGTEETSLTTWILQQYSMV